MRNYADTLRNLVQAGRALPMSTNPMDIAEQAEQFSKELLTLPPTVSIPGHDPHVWRMQTIREAEQFVEVIRRAARRIDARTGPRRAIAQQDALADVGQAEQPLLTRLDDLRFVVETPPPLASEKELIVPQDQSCEASVMRSMLAFSQLATVDEIASGTSKRTGRMVSDVSTRAVIAKLVKSGLAERPNGMKGGVRLTTKGKEVAELLPLIPRT